MLTSLSTNLQTRQLGALGYSPNSDVFRIKSALGQVPLAHAYNPSYSRGRDQEDCSSKPAQANSSQDSIKKSTFLVEWLRV
jgi:hypothetical protein